MILYLSDAKILYHYLHQDFVKYGELIIRIGGDYIPPNVSKPIFEMGFWGNPSKFLMVKLYTIFGAISSFNLYNISLFFAFMAFLSKMILVKASQKMNCSKEIVFISIFVLFLIPYDSLEICGLHKENLTFLCVAFGIVFYRLKKNFLNWVVFITLMIHLFILRPYIGAIILVYVIVLTFFKLLSYRKKNAFLFIGVITLLVTYIVQYYHVIEILINKKDRFSLYAKGRTKLEILQFDQDLVTNFFIVLKSIGRVFYFPYLDQQGLADVGVIVSNFLIIFIVVFGLFFQQVRSKFIYKLIVFVCISVFFVIGFYVPNYGAIIRYRAVFSMIFLWGIVISLDQKVIFRFQKLRNFLYNFFNRLRIR